MKPFTKENLENYLFVERKKIFLHSPRKECNKCRGHFHIQNTDELELTMNDLIDKRIKELVNNTNAQR